MKKITCFVLYSGGLDSMIAAHLMKSLDYEVILLTFRSEFFNRTLEEGEFNINIGEYKFRQLVFDVTFEYLPLLKSPKHGFGKNLNPCIDCKIFFLKKAHKMMDKFNVDFIVTGEVIGQRPKSQKKQPLQCIKKDAGVEDVLIRPLSLKHFPQNEVERKSFIDREKIISIIDIEGRSRKKQIKYAEDNNITDYSSPAGGCLLTHKEYCRKIKPLIDNNIEQDLHFKLLKTGRHFILDKDNFINLVVGKDHHENLFIDSQKTGIVIRLADDIAGPTSIIILKDKEQTVSDEIYYKALNIHCRYSDIESDNTTLNFNIANRYKEDTFQKEVHFHRKKAQGFVEECRI